MNWTRLAPVWLLLAGIMPAISAPAAPAVPGGLPNPFFVFDNGLNDAAHATLAAKAELVRELGFAGVGWRPGDITAMRGELEKRGLGMPTFYVGANIGRGEQKFDPALPGMIRELQGTGSIIWLTLRSKTDKPSAPEGDERAVVIAREIAELARAAGLRVAFYPHFGFWMEKVQDAVRLAQKVDRPNVGATFNLCHYLRVGAAADIPAVLRAARPHLFVVSINGADAVGRDWPVLIQTLDRGTFDQAGFLRELRTIGFTGPIGLQCYNIKGDVRDNLTRSMRAWRALNARLAAPAP